jgi:dihydropteroate synthase
MKTFVSLAGKMIADGAAIIDIGGQTDLNPKSKGWIHPLEI